MNQLTISEINTLAQLPIQDSLLNAFRTRMLIAYTVGLGYHMGSVINGNDIKNEWLVVKEELLSAVTEKEFILYIPLHPIILKIFEAYNNNIPTFGPDDLKPFLKKLAAEMSRSSQEQISEQLWNRRLDITFGSTQSGPQQMQTLGMSVRESRLLTGRSSRHTYPVIGPELQDLFFDQFFDYLIPLGKQHGIDGVELMGV